MARVETVPELYNTTLWKFKAEGNANIILSYVGKNIRYSATVLRLRKDTEFEVESVIDSQYYVNFVMKPLLGSKYVGESVLLKVQPKFLKALSKAILPMRSNKRIQKDIDFKVHYAVLFPDHTRFSTDISPVLSVELKPKWAFLPSSPFINYENSVKLRSCHFCMHKYLKRDKCNSTDDITRYCPLDLFSLEYKRVRKAVEALLDCPGNNLKLFIQGMQVEIGRENWQAQLYKFFEVDYSELDDKEQHKNTYVIDMLIALLIQAIMEEQYLLKRLKMLQKTLDELDIEGINKLLTTYQPKLSEPSLEEWKSIVDEYMKRTTVIDENASKFASITNMDNKQIRQRIYEYLMSTTLKDCSIIFSFQKSGYNNTRNTAEQQSQCYNHSPIFQERLQQISLSEEQSPIKQDDKLYNYKVNVIDLDPKSLEKLSYYQELDTKIVKNYLKYDAINNKCFE